MLLQTPNQSVPTPPPPQAQGMYMKLGIFTTVPRVTWSNSTLTDKDVLQTVNTT